MSYLDKIEAEEYLKYRYGTENIFLEDARWILMFNKKLSNG